MLIKPQQTWNTLSKQFWANKNKALFFGASGAAGGAFGSMIGEIVMAGTQRGLATSFIDSIGLIIRVGIWFGLAGASILIALLLGYYWYLNKQFRPRQVFQEGTLPGCLAGILAGAIAQVIYGISPNELLRVVCWGIAGGLLGLGLSFKIRNLGKWRGLFGGILGGMIGGCLFILFTFLTGEVTGRFFGLAAIGFFIGLMIILVEAVFRDAWLVVHWSPTEQKTLSLGREAILLGSSDRAQIYLPKQQGYPSVTAQLYTREKEVILQFDPDYARDRKMQKSTQILKDGDRRQFGNLILEVKISRS